MEEYIMSVHIHFISFSLLVTTFCSIYLELFYKGCCESFLNRCYKCNLLLLALLYFPKYTQLLLQNTPLVSTEYLINPILVIYSLALIESGSYDGA